jgi:hypothetical protein
LLCFSEKPDIPKIHLNAQGFARVHFGSPECAAIRIPVLAGVKFFLYWNLDNTAEQTADILARKFARNAAGSMKPGFFAAYLI